MVIFGDDSLNEHSEDNNFGADSSMNSLRMRLKKSTVPVEKQEPTEDHGPSRAQLIATGEADEDELGEGEIPDSEELTQELKEETPTGLAVLKALPSIPETTSGIRRQIEEGLLAGETRDELVARGFNKRSVQTIASELKSKMNTRTAIGKAPLTTSKGMPIFAHGSPPEAIIESISVPDVANGEGVPFEQGIKFGMSLVILGVRVAQELSGIGITQAKPILDMAKSMREGEAIAAKNAGAEAAMEAAGMVRDSMMPLLTNIQRGGGGGEGGDPMKKMMVDTMQPIIQRLMGGALGRLAPGAQPPQLTEGQGGVDGWTHKSE